MLRCTEKLKCIHCSTKCLVPMHIPLELVNELLARWRSWAIFKGLVIQRMPRGTCQIPYVTCAVHSNKMWCSWQRPVYYWGFVPTPWSERLSSYRSGTVSLPFHGYNIRSLCCQQIVQCVRRVLFCRKLWGRNKQPVTVALEGNWMEIGTGDRKYWKRVSKHFSCPVRTQKRAHHSSRYLSCAAPCRENFKLCTP